MITRIRKALTAIMVALLLGGVSASLSSTPANAAEQSFYALLRSKTSASYSLATVNPANATTTSVKQLDFSAVAGRQYGDLRSGGYSTQTGLFYAFDTTYQELYSIDPQSGLVTHRGTFSPAVTGGVTAMAINSSGTGYAMGANNLLYTVVLTTGALYNGVPIKNLAATTRGIESMSFDGAALYAYAERTNTYSSDAAMLGLSLKIEYSSSQWAVTDSHVDSSKATGAMDAYGIVVHSNTWLINQLVSGENRLVAAAPTTVNQSVTYSSRGVLAAGTGQLVRGLYSAVPETLTFDSNGGSEMATSVVYGANGSKISEPSSPTRSGASFEGWFTQRTGGTKITWPYTLTSSTTVYAQWNATPATLSFDSHGGSAVASISAYVGDEISQPADPTLSGYGFDGWYTAETGGTQVSWPYPLNADTTLHAVWTQTPATLSLKQQNGDPDVSISSFEGVEIDEPVAPTKSGASFKGWYTAQSGGTIVTWPYTLSAGSNTLWAQWEATLQFVSAGGTPVDQVVADLGTAVSAPTAPTYTYRTFDGWFDAATGGNQISWPLTLNSNTTVYAQWSQIPATVSFDSHGGSSVDPVSTFQGEWLTEPTEPTKTNAAFEGWFDQASEGTKVVWSLFVTQDVTLHAQWNTVPVTLSFDSQGGSPVASIDTYAGEEIAVPTPPTRSGYTFVSWFESTTSEQEVVWPFEVTSNVTLYARWTQNSPELAATGASGLFSLGVVGMALLGGGAFMLLSRVRPRHF